MTNQSWKLLRQKQYKEIENRILKVSMEEIEKHIKKKEEHLDLDKELEELDRLYYEAEEFVKNNF